MSALAQMTDAQLVAYYKQYADQLLDQLIKAHETIGELRYDLKKYGIKDSQQELAEKKRIAIARGARILKFNPFLFKKVDSE